MFNFYGIISYLFLTVHRLTVLVICSLKMKNIIYETVVSFKCRRVALFVVVVDSSQRSDG